MYSKVFPANKQAFIELLVRNVSNEIDRLPNEIKGKAKNAFDLYFRDRLNNLAKTHEGTEYVGDSIINKVVLPIIFSSKIPPGQHLLVRDICVRALDKTFKEINTPTKVVMASQPTKKALRKPTDKMLPTKEATKILPEPLVTAAPVIEAITEPRAITEPTAKKFNVKTLLIPAGIVAALIIATQLKKK